MKIKSKIASSFYFHSFPNPFRGITTHIFHKYIYYLFSSINQSVTCKKIYFFTFSIYLKKCTYTTVLLLPTHNSTMYNKYSWNKWKTSTSLENIHGNLIRLFMYTKFYIIKCFLHGCNIVTLIHQITYIRESSLETLIFRDTFKFAVFNTCCAHKAIILVEPNLTLDTVNLLSWNGLTTLNDKDHDDYTRYNIWGINGFFHESMYS